MKMKKRITVIIDAEFGVDHNDEWDDDENAYPGPGEHDNILGAIADGTAAEPDQSVYVELGSGDVVRGDLVAVTVAEPPAGDKPIDQSATPSDVQAGLYAALCDVVERSWWHLPTDPGDGEMQMTSDRAREGANRILEAVQEAARAMVRLNGPSGERQVVQGLQERDAACDAADELTAIIQILTGVDMGDHSNTNEPWANAIEAGAAFLTVSGFEYGIGMFGEGHAPRVHRVGMTEAGARSFLDHPDMADLPRPEALRMIRRRRGPWGPVPDPA